MLAALTLRGPVAPPVPFPNPRPVLDFNRSSDESSPTSSSQSSRQRGPVSSHFAAKQARPSIARFSSSSSAGAGAGSGARPRSTKPKTDLLTKRHSPSQFVLLDPSTPPSPSTGSSSSTATRRPARTFAELGLDDQVTAAMMESIRSSFGSSPPDHIAPTEIQSLAARAIIDPPPKSTQGGQPRAFMLAAETGSGKTLAYLAPVLHTIRTQEQEYAVQYEAFTKALAEAQVKHDEAIAHNAKVTQAQSDSLLHQVGSVAKAMSHTARARIVMATTSTPAHHFKRIMTEPVDVLITTPGSLAEFINKEAVKLSETRLVVVDEADFVFDQGFDEEARQVVQHVCKVARTRSTHHGSSSALTTASGDFVPTFLFVTATVPKSLHAMLTTQFPTPGSLQFLATSSLHRPLTRCTQSFVDVANQFQSNKQAALLDVLRTTHDFDHGAALVFANKRQGVDTVYSFLTSRNIPNVLKLSKRQTIEERAATWHAFRTTPGAVLVATDVAARGLDTTHVDLVVNFDFPSSALEYLHRIGRTARAGRKGRAVSLVTRRSKELVLAIQQRLKMKSGMGMGRMA
ncbi:P-loop containing nucleoside triphosphate hydrolase protein [Catenaria anguillulae PL171]|uniref:p-loop containing nucleoside triphosphate hydrolase protein n=1 Tax=Catenaria anguillulae PL171 TaxID=765915 RepID=A0A1Y2I271_9FUNG|nr:P-loop containing nucleoside triphosphate hydrolase protein [Catenaria anguillulae PL171]